MVKTFTFKGKTLDELQNLNLEDFANLLTSKEKRHILRGLSEPERKLLKKIRKAKLKGKTTIQTHAREMVIIPEMIGLTINIHNGKTFLPFEIKEEMLGKRLGEFSHTTRLGKHGMAGVGATRSSLYVPLK